MVNVLILDLGDDIVGNCEIQGFEGKIIVQSYTHGVTIPMQMDPSQTERTCGRPVFSEMVFTKMSDLSTTEIYKACSQGVNLPLAVLEVGRVEGGAYMSLLHYEMTNAMVSGIHTHSGESVVPSDTFSLNFTQLKCDYTQQQPDSTAKGTGTWNWNMVTMQAE